MSIATTIQSCLSEHKVEDEIVPNPKTGSSHETAQDDHIFQAQNAINY